MLMCGLLSVRGRRWYETTVTTPHTSSARSAPRGVGAAMITPTANTECMNLHLKEISTQVTPGARAALICDGAGWHQRGGTLTWTAPNGCLHREGLLGR